MWRKGTAMIEAEIGLQKSFWLLTQSLKIILIATPIHLTGRTTSQHITSSFA